MSNLSCRYSYDFGESSSSVTLRFFDSSGLIGSPIAATNPIGNFWVCDAADTPETALGARWAYTGAISGANHVDVDIQLNQVRGKLFLLPYSQPIQVLPTPGTDPDTTVVFANAVDGQGQLADGDTITCTLVYKGAVPAISGDWAILGTPQTLIFANGQASGVLATNDSITPSGTKWHIVCEVANVDYYVGLISGSFDLFKEVYS